MKKFILGTDWWTDCDDAVAIRILARAHKDNRIKLEGIGINACMEHSVTSLEGFLNLEGVTDIPIGIDMNATDFGGNPPYQKRLADYAVKYSSNDQAENAVRLYRRILANSSSPIEIIEIGYLQVISAVLESKADDISLKSGLELIREKVSKIWVMAGKWDEDGGLENNFCRNERSRVAAEKFCRLCPVPVTFLGFEIGKNVITGGFLNKQDHLHKVLCDHRSENGRCSWDPMLVQLAIVGDCEKAGYSTVRGTASVDKLTGANSFVEAENGNHCFVRAIHDTNYYENAINELIK